MLRETFTRGGSCLKPLASAHIVPVEFCDVGLQRTAQVRDVAVDLCVALELRHQVIHDLQVVQLTVMTTGCARDRAASRRHAHIRVSSATSTT